MFISAVNKTTKEKCYININLTQKVTLDTEKNFIITLFEDECYNDYILNKREFELFLVNQNN